jgi:predicted transcriptional regulator of viral defense system
MKTKRDELIQVFKQNRGVLRFSQVLKASFHRKHLKSLLESGKIEKIGHGLYRLKDAPALSNPDLVTVALKAPNGVICLISALYYHRATDEIPRKVDVAIPRRPWANKIDYPPVQYFRFSEKAWKAGVETHTIDGYSVRIYSLAKTIADCFKYRNKIGLNIARDALKTSVVEKKVKLAEVMRFAEICRVDKIIRPYLEALL